MTWTVETLNGVVDAELEELPADMRARFQRISQIIAEFGLERVREPNVKHVRGPLVGNAPERERGDLTGSLRDRGCPACRGSTGLHQENAEDAQPEIALALKRAKEILR